MDFSTYMVPAVAVATYLVCAVLKRFMGENSKYLCFLVSGDVWI